MNCYHKDVVFFFYKFDNANINVEIKIMKIAILIHVIQIFKVHEQ